MLLGIDHLVIAVRDPDAAASTIERDLGIAFTGGGRHEHGGRSTASRSSATRTSSSSACSIGRSWHRRRGPRWAARRSRVLDAGREGLATFALATDDIDGDVGRLRAAGSPIAAPVDGSRARPDGDVVRWRTARGGRLGPCEPPFLIEHETPAPSGATGRAPRARRSGTRAAGGSAWPGWTSRARIPSPRRARTRRPSGSRSSHRAADVNEARAGAQVVRLSRRQRRRARRRPRRRSGPSRIDLVRLGIRWRGAR